MSPLRVAAVMNLAAALAALHQHDWLLALLFLSLSGALEVIDQRDRQITALRRSMQ